MRSAVVIALWLASVPFAAWCQAFQPARPVEIVVHNAPGGSSDLLARHITALMEKEKLLPVRAVANNRSGGGELRNSSAGFVARMREGLKEAGLKVYR